MQFFLRHIKNRKTLNSIFENVDFFILHRQECYSSKVNVCEVYGEAVLERRCQARFGKVRFINFEIKDGYLKAYPLEYLYLVIVLLKKLEVWQL